MSTPNCPQCNKPLEKVRYPSDSMLNRDQWDSIRAGDYCCRSCPSNGRGAVWAYFWESEVNAAAAPLSAPQPEPSSHPDRPNYCCENGDFGDNHECRKQPGVIAIKGEHGTSYFKAEVASSPSPTQPTWFEKLPVRIQAMQLTKDSVSRARIIQWVHEGLPREANSIAIPLEFGTLSIRTLEGAIYAAPGDWIIRGIAGEFYPCKPDIFAKTYRSIDEPKSGEWVKVTPETLPSFSTEVLATCWSYRGDGPRFVTVAVCEENGWWQFDRESEEYSAKMYTPTHWMPLPSPPKENQ